jgi:hypothetical protein
MVPILISLLKIIVGRIGASINCPRRTAKASLQHGGEGRPKEKKKKKRASVPGAETSENQGETLERRHFSALPFLGSIRQKR